MDDKEKLERLTDAVKIAIGWLKAPDIARCEVQEILELALQDCADE
jgi:hypothetical protein